jgi:hypothetical protein
MLKCFKINKENRRHFVMLCTYTHLFM